MTFEPYPKTKEYLQRLKALADMVVTTEMVECDEKYCAGGYMIGWDDKTCPKCHGTGQIEKLVPGPLLEALIARQDDACHMCGFINQMPCNGCQTADMATQAITEAKKLGGLSE